jgi:hypothetical protein
VRAALCLLAAGAGIVAVCLGALWASVTVGCWLALASMAGGWPTPSQVLAVALLLATGWILWRSLRLLAADLRHPRIGRQL